MLESIRTGKEIGAPEAICELNAEASKFVSTCQVVGDVETVVLVRMVKTMLVAKSLVESPPICVGSGFQFRITVLVVNCASAVTVNAARVKIVKVSLTWDLSVQTKFSR